MNNPTARRFVTWLCLVVWTLVIICALSLTTARADRPAGGRWVQLLSRQRGEFARITSYGPHYAQSPHWCASGRVYTDDGRFAALGPSMLRQARVLTGQKWPTIRVDVPGRDVLVVPVADTGGINAEGTELDVDLPDKVWAAQTDVDPYIGIFRARVWVWVPEGSERA